MEQINKTNKQTLHSEHELKLAEKQKWENKNVINFVQAGLSVVLRSMGYKKNAMILMLL